MKIMHSEWSDRISHWIRTLKEDFYEPLGEITWEAFKTDQYLSLDELEAAAFLPVEEGYEWGKLYEYCWLKGSIILPEEAQGQRIVMNLNPGGESAVFVNRKAFGTYRAEWVNERHHFMIDNAIARAASGGSEYEIIMETYAGHFYPEYAPGACATGPVLPGTYTNPLPEGSRRRLGKCTYGIWNEAAYQLYMDVDTLNRLLLTLDEGLLRSAKIAQALEEFTLTVDFEQEKPERIQSYGKAAELLRPAMEAVNGSTVPVFYAVGNAHLDLAWLWPLEETYRKTERTFAAQLRLLEEYPEYKFIQSQPASYEMCRRHYPELFERIRDAIQKGQWIAEGAMWVEPDTNMTSGESLIRQLYYGKRYFKEVLGVESEILWLPDTFGYSAVLPQLLKGCGVKYLVTQKIFWSYNEGEQFPYHYFNWVGMDGTEIVSFLPTSYTYKTDPEEVNNLWKNRTQMRDLDAFLLPYGYGDGGGGPARDHIEYAKRQQNLEGGVSVKMAGPKEFFEDMEEKGGAVNSYVGELYFSAHRGTYTSQAMVKELNRRTEFALRELEVWGAIATGRGWTYPVEEMETMWKELLLHQFHDILPGSSIEKVYEETGKSLGAVLERSDSLTKEAMDFMMEQAGQKDEEAVTIFNSFSFPRREVVELPDAFAHGAYDENNVKIFCEKINGKVKAIVELPPCGAITICPAAEGKVQCPESKYGRAVIRKINGSYVMENSEITAVVNPLGQITSFQTKTSGREYAAAPLNSFHLYKDVPRAFDAWDIDSNYAKQEIEGLYDVCVEVVSEGIEAVLKVTGKIGKSQLIQYIRLSAVGKRVEFDTYVDWKELHRLLKTAFPVMIYAENGINEMQFGFVERPAHRSRAYEKDRFEVCQHRYSALYDGTGGAAVLNDCKYGISMDGNSLALTLLRASASPEMRADNRVHHFTYAFTAWEDSFVHCDVVRQGYELNQKPIVRKGKLKAFRMLEIEKDNIIMETMKPAEDGSGDLIFRFYESKKAAAVAGVTFCLPEYRAYICDMLENIIEEIPAAEGQIHLKFGVFEVKTIRIRGKKNYGKLAL